VIDFLLVRLGPISKSGSGVRRQTSAALLSTIDTQSVGN
jgi:hypothetical protein